jgi:hypothetical protein
VSAILPFKPTDQFKKLGMNIVPLKDISTPAVCDMEGVRAWEESASLFGWEVIHCYTPRKNILWNAKQSACCPKYFFNCPFDDDDG